MPAKALALKGGASVFAFAVALLASPAMAAPCPDQQNVAFECDGPVQPVSGTFENSATINDNATPIPGVRVETDINIYTFTNAVSGIINGDIDNQGAIGTPDNLG